MCCVCCVRACLSFFFFVFSPLRYNLFFLMETERSHSISLKIENSGVTLGPSAKRAPAAESLKSAKAKAAAVTKNRWWWVGGRIPFFFPPRLVFPFPNASAGGKLSHVN